MNWVFQKTGTINRYNKDIHLGTQPVRVIHQMLAFMFQRTHPSFFKDLMKQINDGKLSNELNLIFGEEPIRAANNSLRTPRVNFDSKQIELHESFLSYLWCCTYSVYVVYLETIDYPRVNKANGKVTHPISKDNIDKAEHLFEYAKYLIVDFQAWDKENLPNPEIYLAEKRIYVEQTTVYYTEAVKFILCHEFTHLKLHVEQINEHTTNSHFLAFEMEADNNAIDLMKQGISHSPDAMSVSHKLYVEMGIIFGILSMFFFRATTEGVKHPNAEDRLTSALERLGLHNDHPAWGIACVGLQMWDKQFGLNLKWSEIPIPYKDQYYDIIGQIKGR